ncbi:MAG TPA: replication-relaxation family protein [Solirubrobacterales bacterium]
MSATAKPTVPVASAEVLASLAQHRVLSTPQIGEIHFPERSQRWAQMAMARLWRAGLAVFAPSGARRAPRRLWFVTGLGAQAALDAGLLERMPRLLDPATVVGPLQRHTAAVNDAAISFLRAARERDDEFGPLSWRHEVPHRLGQGRRAGTLFADAVLTYVRMTAAEVVVEQRFLELDRATLSVDRLAAELARYARLLNVEGKKGESLWRAQYPDFPAVLCVLAGADRAVLRRRRDTAVALLQSNLAFEGSPELSVRFCLAEDLAERGPFEPIFTDAREPEEPVDWLDADTAEGES